MSRKFTQAMVLGLLLALLATPYALADDVYARIRGTATDSTGAVISGVQVTATNTLTNYSKTVTTQSTGIFEFVQLPIGPYTVTATKQGFRTYKSTGITLEVNQVLDLPVQLAVGSVSETVEVKANAVQVQTDNTQQGTLVNSQQIVDLPLIGRNFTQLEQLAPGVMSASDRFGTFSVNGSQTQQSSYTINGTDNNDIPLNTALILPSPDAIQEFNLISSTINPEYGRNSGGIVNALIKNGTNQYHGNAFDFYRDTFLNTHNFFQPAVPVFHQNVFGGTFGGPIRKDKTFFFASYQGTRARTAVGQVTSVYSPAERTGNFNDIFGAPGGIAANKNVTPFALVGDDNILHPAGTPYFSAGCLVPGCATIFHAGANFGNLSGATLNPLAVSLMNKFVPLANFVNNQFSFNPITNTIADQGIARIDHNLTSSDQLWGVAIFNHSPSNTALAFTGATLPGWGEVDTRESKEFTIAENHTFSTTTLNEFRLGYARFNFDAVEPATPAQPSSFGFAGINSQNTVSASMPRITVTGLFTLGFSTNGPQPRKDQNYQITDNFSKVVGRHTFKFGFDGRRFQVDNPFFGRNNGSFAFGGSGVFSTGNPGLDFLLGIPDTYSQGAGGVINARAYEYYGYAQDSWKVKSNLTLNYGAGYQVDTPYNSHQFGGVAQSCFIPGEQSTIFPTAPAGMTYPGDAGCNQSGGTSIHYGHIAPRFGFAWSPHFGGKVTGAAENKFSVRGGIGLYYNRTEEEGALQNLGTPPFGVSSAGIGDIGFHPSFASPFIDITNSANTLANKFPFTNFPKPGDATINFAKFEPLGINTFNSNLTTPYAMNFNFNIQREFPGNTVLTLGYVGALGRHLYRAYDANFITAAGQLNCLTAITVINGKNVPCLANRASQHLLFPQDALVHGSLACPAPVGSAPGTPGACFGGVGQQFTDGTSNYSALQINVNKGMTHGLQLLISYTWSHAIDNGSSLENSGFGGAARGTNILDPQLNVGDSANDARQRLVLGYVYNIPNLHHLAHWAPDRVFGGWKLSGITTFQTGFPFSFTDSGFTSLSCDSFDFYACADNPNQIGPIHALDPRVATFKGKQNFFFDPTQFARASFGTFGNTGRNSFHGPGINNTDFALIKDTKITERTTFEMGIEGYNVFNHTQFGTATVVPTNNILSANFGRITAAAPARLVQLRAKVNF
jgi:hypothetical protein